MKYTSTVLAGLATTVAAQNWEQWSSSNGTVSSTTSSKHASHGTSSTTSSSSSTITKSATTSSAYCPSEVTSTVTKTETVAEVTSEVYATTVYVEAPETKTVTVYADGKTAKGEWEMWDWSSTSKATNSVTIPAGCVPNVKTSTKVESVKKAGSTTTMTGSTLFVGPAKGPKTTVTVTASGSAPTGAWGEWNGGSNGGSGNGNGNGNGAGAQTTDKIVASGADAYKWTVAPAPTQKHHSEAPQYTQLPNGGWGVGDDSWDDWKGSNNGTKNATIPEYGSPASNVTKPFPPLTNDKGCNNAYDRGKWCDGKSVADDYYKDYFSNHYCDYDLTITNTTLNHDGTEVLALAVNGQVPGPLIECNWGDVVRIKVHNKLQNNGTSIHWHGIRQVGTNDMDGVPGVTECPLAPGETRTYEWHASSYGTSWYHSHWGAQYGDGVIGPMVIHGPATANYDVDAGVVQVSDTFPVTAAQWNSVIAHFGPKGTSNYLLNGKNTKADLSAGQHSLWKVQKGKKYLFRLINSAAQNMYSISVDGHKMKVIAADFIPIVPYETEWVNIGIGQRYDVVIEMNQNVDSYFMRAVTQTQCPSACDNTGLGQANGIIAYEGVQEKPYLLPTSTTNKAAADFDICDDEPLASLVPFVVKTGGSATAFQAQASTLPAGFVNTVKTNDDGTVFRWYINNGAININYTQPTLQTLATGGNSSLISNPITLSSKNQWVYFVIQNQFFAAHPMHLHGHDFSVLGQGSGVFDESLVPTLNFVNPMRRDTAMLKGAAGPAAKKGPGYTVIGFETDNPGVWLMHCHIIWHVDGGLSLQWLERPDEIQSKKYYSNSFQNTCSAYSKYENQGPFYQKTTGMSGLKARNFFEEQVSKLSTFQFDEVVRRSGSSEKRYLDSHALKRGIGNSRHFRR